MKRTPLRRRTPLRKRNARRLKRLRAAAFGPQAALCRTMPCSTCGAPPPSDPHHLKSRGAGGLDDSCIALCRTCHDRLHSMGLFSFQHAMRVNFNDVLSRMRARVADAEQPDDSPVSPLLALWE